MNNFRIATKLWLTVGLIIISLASLIGFSAFKLLNLQTESEARLSGLSARVKAVSTWAGLTETNSLRTMSMITSWDPKVMELLSSAISDTSAKISTLQQDTEAMVLNPQESAQIQKIAGSRTRMAEFRVSALKLKADGNSEEALRVGNEQYTPAVTAYIAELNELVTLQENAMAAFLTQAAQGRTNMASLLGGGSSFFLRLFWRRLAG
jgi:methyl-accepting chemotaxis protein